MLIIRLPHCLTAIVGNGKALKSNWKNCSCKYCSCAGHDGQIICQPVAPDVLRYVYTQTYTYTHMQSIRKRKMQKGTKNCLEVIGRLYVIGENTLDYDAKQGAELRLR